MAFDDENMAFGEYLGSWVSLPIHFQLSLKDPLKLPIVVNLLEFSRNLTNGYYKLLQ